jgi:hypothetical protein
VGPRCSTFFAELRKRKRIFHEWEFGTKPFDFEQNGTGLLEDRRFWPLLHRARRAGEAGEAPSGRCLEDIGVPVPTTRPRPLPADLHPHPGSRAQDAPFEHLATHSGPLKNRFLSGDHHSEVNFTKLLHTLVSP